MSCKFLLALGAGMLLVVSLSALSSAGELKQIRVDYEYTDKHGIDFTELKNPPLAIQSFTDAREGATPHLISDAPFAGSAGYQSQRPVADIIRDAFQQAFVAGDAPLAEGDAATFFSGELLELTSTLDENEQTIEITLKTKVALKDANKTLWQNTLFARGSAPREQGINGAMSAALDRLIQELMYDDYFLLQALK